MALLHRHLPTFLLRGRAHLFDPPLKTRWTIRWANTLRCGRDASPHVVSRCKAPLHQMRTPSCLSASVLSVRAGTWTGAWKRRGRGRERLLERRSGLVSMLADTLLLFREISVRPSSRFISSHNHELSELSYSRGSACRQVSVSTAAEPKYLLNPSSLFNYPRVLEKWCKPSCISDTLPTPPMTARACGPLAWTADDEQRAERAWNGVQVRIIKRRLNWGSLKV